jgi:NhaP-type Na+/H+ or K+/H+ antiporter
MSIEELWYEASPYIYILLGITVLFGSNETLGLASGGLLLVAAGTILRLRWLHRHRRNERDTRSMRRTQADRPPRGRSPDDRPIRSAR